MLNPPSSTTAAITVYSLVVMVAEVQMHGGILSRIGGLCQFIMVFFFITVKRIDTNNRSFKMAASSEKTCCPEPFRQMFEENTSLEWLPEKNKVDLVEFSQSR